ncbi:Protein of unknown function [Cognatiyoonia koreensis]|uniref:DUF1499 domain-containing protein n=1 Tax=Cognatiyoonia koreensis TaxID=364200 RepID=A0A1I0NYM5_9RHOB|nr:DUF1499 domain-containing protein [Cognatiyoonia koreensis]SEW06649.1 Protein of unknown function [Cognatiyoonia koreensis]
MRWIAIAIVVSVLGGMAYVRLAPADHAALNQPSYPKPVGDYPSAGGFHAVRRMTASEADMLKAVDTIALGTARTKRVAGSVEDGILTYETRSRIMGFPDYTTVWVDSGIDGDGPHLNIKGRLRFGSADLGVNKARVESWLGALGPLIVEA